MISTKTIVPFCFVAHELLTNWNGPDWRGEPLILGYMLA